MTREELEHAIRAACDVSGEDEVYVFGSQAILGQYPNAHPDLTMSAEADIAPINNEDNSDLIAPLLPSLRNNGCAYRNSLDVEAIRLVET